MTASPEPVRPTRRLNPFALPSETTFRFILLVVAVVGTSLFIANWLYFAWEPRDQAGTYQRCLAEAVGSDLLAASARLSDCLAAHERQKALLIIAGATLVMGVAALAYWLLPALKLRRRRLEPIAADDLPEVTEYLAELSREAGLKLQPSFVWNPLDPRSWALAFGRLGCYYVALGGGLVGQFYADRRAFRAVVLHELAHLRNGDVNKAYFAVTAWWAFVALGLVPFALTLLDEGLATIRDIGWRVLALTALIYLTRNAVLRAREAYADVRASTWDGPDGGLRTVLEKIPRPATARLRSLMSVHPDPRERRRLLDATEGLFKLRFWDAFSAGMAATIAFPSVASLLSLLATGTEYVSLSRPGAALLCAPFAAAVVAIGAWRATLAALAGGTPLPRVLSPALGLGAGLAAGEAVSLDAAIRPGGGSAGELSRVALDFSWAALLVLLVLFFVRWVVTTARPWLQVAATSGSPRTVHGAGVAVAAAVLAWAFGQLSSINSFVESLRDDPSVLSELGLPAETVWRGVDWLVTQSTVTFVILASVWAFPLAAWLMRRRRAAGAAPRWAFLEGPEPDTTFAEGRPLQLRLALGVGVGAGLLVALALIAWRIGIHATVAEVERDTDDYLLGFLYRMEALAVAVQAVAAVVVMSRAHHSGAALGLLSAFITGCITVAATLGLTMLAGCVDALSIRPSLGCPSSIEGSFAWTQLKWWVNEGALAAMVAMAAAAAAQEAIRSIRHGRLQALPRS